MTAEEYLKEHGINEETIKTFELSWDENHLNIPIRDKEGGQLFTKSRNLNYGPGSEEPKYKNSQGSHATLFNYYAVAESEKIIITEGEVDAMKLYQEGLSAISSTGGAGTFPEDFVFQLKDKEIWVCFDNDPAGRKGIDSILEKLPNAKIILLPDNIKDVCDYFQDKTLKDFYKLMKKAKDKDAWIAANVPLKHKIMHGNQLMEKEFPEVPWIIDSVLYKEGFCFIYGAEGTGKSFIALDMAKAIAEGTPWLDTFKVPAPINVLYLDKENPHSLMQKRAKGLGGIPDNLCWLEFPAEFQLYDNNGKLTPFATDLSSIVKTEKIGLIIIDSFVDLMIGNESSAGDTQVFFDSLRILFPNIAYLVLHHENKPAAGTFRNSAQRLRGSTNINAQTFTMFRLEAIAKSKIDLTLQQTKARDEQKMDKFMIQMQVEPNPAEENKTIVTGFDYVGVVSSDASDNAEVEDSINLVIGMSEDGSISRKDLITDLEASGISQRTIDRTIKKMLDGKNINKFKKGREVYYGDSEPIVDEITPQGGMF